MPEFRFLAKVAEFCNRNAQTFEIDGVEIAVFKSNGVFHALANRCTHTGGPLVLGQVSEGEVTCPWHSATFELDTGKALCAPATEGAKVYKLRVVGEHLEIEL
ncbi:Rieske (2Fe-2S) protein [bacterium]|nr:Rieske (2Fe-2S) protein [bacterium]